MRLGFRASGFGFRCLGRLGFRALGLGLGFWGVGRLGFWGVGRLGYLAVGLAVWVSGLGSGFRALGLVV